jgi:type II secretory pathway pseudopilin PulG
MEKGVGLVELLIALACSSILFLALYQFFQVSSVTHKEMREAWYCMQSLRQASIQLNTDLVQCALLLPQDLKIAVQDSELFIAGVPVTSENPGISVSLTNPAPYYALINSSAEGGAILDTVDIDNDGHADFWADLGLLTESGPCVVGHNYTRGNNRISLTCAIMPVQGNRAVPAIHYELKGDGLYRNNQLLAEAVVLFDPTISGNDLTIHMRSRYHGTEKELSLSSPIQ